jgi:hypothetical protein
LDIAVSVDCVSFGFDENVLKVLLIKSDLLNLRINGVYWATWLNWMKIWTPHPIGYCRIEPG